MMNKLLLNLAILLFSSLCFSQSEITGQFSTEAVSMTFGQPQRGQSGNNSTTLQVGRSYLTVNGKIYKLYRYSKKEIENLTNTGTDGYQTQQPISVMSEDFYLLGFHKENNNYCLFQGVIDEDSSIIYNAKLIKTYDTNEIISALSKCGNK